MNNKILLIFIFSLITMTKSKRILAVFPTPSISHQLVFRPIMQELAKRGHQVTVITPDPAFAKGDTPQNLTEIDVHDVAYRIFTKRMNSKGLERGKKGNAVVNIKNALKFASATFVEEMKSCQVQSLINDTTNTFDLLFIENFFRHALCFTHLYKVPVIEISSLAGQFNSYESVGAVTHSLIYPLSLQPKIFNLTLWEKLYELHSRYSVDYAFNLMEQEDNDISKRLFGSNIPDFKELRKNIQLSFFNVDPIWDLNRPVPSSVKYLGGLHQQAAKQLPQDLQSYLDSSEHGVVYVSFGTNTKLSMLQTEKLTILKKVFTELPYNFLWKRDKEEPSIHFKNIRTSYWFPQSDLLKHNNVKLFITQGGLQSTDEALVAGVPLICIPMVGDQWFNAEQYVKHNIGVHLSFETLTEDILKTAINTVIEDQSYRDSVVRLRTILHDQPLTPLERAVRWTEYVLRQEGGGGGGEHLRSPAAHMHWTEYYELELVFIMLAVLVVTVTTLTYLIRCVVLKLRNNCYDKSKRD